MKEEELRVRGIPELVDQELAERCRAELEQTVRQLLQASGLEEIALLVETPSAGRKRDEARRNLTRNRVGEELSVEERAQQFVSSAPLYPFDFLVVPESVRENLLAAADLVRLEQQVFREWNLRAIEPFPSVALNLHGPPGTGKTLAAHALADHLGCPILASSYARIESKFHSEGAKNVEALFYAAQRDGALLFVDEADSLLSRRLVHVTQGSEHAINSLRSQLLVSVERFRGVVVFSTNLIECYDRAFETRMRHIHFPMPDAAARLEIWRRHLPRELPLGEDVSIERLAEVEQVCGRDIKNAVIQAALRVARAGRTSIAMADLTQSLQNILSTRILPGV